MITEFEKTIFNYLDFFEERNGNLVREETQKIVLNNLQRIFELEKRHAKNLLIKWMEAK